MKPKKPKVPILNRFTTLPIALDILSRKQLTLLSPDTWEDRNDAYYLERYADKKKLKSLLAICFSLSGETFHHWRVFSSGSSGVCIEFDKAAILESFSAAEGCRSGKVIYRWVDRLEKKPPRLRYWPFYKRRTFRDEREFRVIYESNSEENRTKGIDFDLASVRKVTLSPWLPNSVAKSVTDIINGMAGCGAIKVNRSSLIENARWRRVIDREMAKP